MSYYVYDSRGFLGDAASLRGWEEFCAWAQKQVDVIKAFVDDGHATDLQALGEALDFAKCSNPDVGSIRKNVITLLKKAHDVVIVNEGDHE